jgi:two-component system, LytTR family, sensor kinase
MRWERWVASFWGRAILLFAVSTIAGLFFATQFYYVMKAWGTPVEWGWVIPVRLWAWYEWGLLFLLVLWLGRRFPLAGGVWKRHLPLHLVAGAVIAVVQIVVNTWTHLTFVANPANHFTYTGYLESLMMFAFHRNLLIYWVMIGGQHAFRTYRELQAQKLAASEMDARLAEARLRALETQLHPHFLFNTLNTIAALVRRDPAKAERVIGDLGDLLRLALDDVTARKVSLARETEFLERYVQIQKARFGERLRYESDLAPDLLGALVPNLLLQPAVENAIRFAVLDRYRGGRVVVRAERSGRRLVLTVDDDGPGLTVPPEQALGSGVGLSATKARLDGLYAGDSSIILERSRLGGLSVRFELPFERSDAPVDGAAGEPDDTADDERGAAA